MKKRFSKTKTFNKTSISNIPEDKPIVYRLKSERNEDLYAGVAKRNRTQERLLEHLVKKSEKIPGAKKVQIMQFDNIEKAKKEEKKLIKNLNPKYNK